MKTIIFATGNKDKMKEIREILGEGDYEILSMKEAGVDTDIEEDGTTFEENAMIKAKTVYELYQKRYGKSAIVLADDSGLEIDYLNKEPGIYSARYLGHDTPYEVKNADFLRRLEGVPKEKRTARFVCAIAGIFDDGTEKVCRATIEGYIGPEPMGENGFGFDPIFYIDPLGVSTAAIPPEEKHKISHRGKALRMMREELKAWEKR